MPPEVPLPPMAPLKGIRILSLERWHALALGTAFLADFGAEVIRVESADDMVDRSTGPFPDKEPSGEWWNESGTFTYMNRGKESLCLEIADPRGREVFRRLAAHCDVVADNFRPGTMERWGLGHSSLAKLNPTIITLSSTGYGHTGPWSQAGGRGRTADASSGLTYLTGYEGGPAVRASGNYMDYIAGNNNAFALLLAIYRVRKEGKGSRIDVSMQEGGTESIGPALLEAQFGYVRPRLDTGHLWKSPHRLYPCSGKDRWIAITVSDDEEWGRLKTAMANPAWTGDHTLDTALGRWQGRHEIDRRMAAWTGTWDFMDLMGFLQGRGVTAGAAMTAAEISEDPHLNGRGYYQTIQNDVHPRVGPRQFPGRPFQIPGIPVQMERSPDLGEHNLKVLRDIGGLAEKEIEQLYEQGILGTSPH